MSSKENLFSSFLVKMQTELNSKSELLICETVLENMNTIQNLDIRDLARMSGVSTATISRFVNQFPVKSYREFIHYLAISHSRMSYTIEENHQRVTDETLSGIYENEKSRAIHNLEMSKEQVNAAGLSKLHRYIDQSSTVTIIGANHSLELFNRVQQALFSIGKICYIYRQKEKCQAHIDTLQKGSLVIFVAIAGRYQNNAGNQILQQLKNKNIRCVLISQTKEIPEQNFDLVIHFGQDADRNVGYYSLETLADVLAKSIVK